jgi:hypothetical protein
MYSRPDIIYPHQFPKLEVLPLILQSRQFHTKIKTSQRIGPHNLDVISILVGCLINPNLRVNLMIIKRTFHLISVTNSNIKGIQILDEKSIILLNPIWVT